MPWRGRWALLRTVLLEGMEPLPNHITSPRDMHCKARPRFRVPGKLWLREQVVVLAGMRRAHAMAKDVKAPKELGFTQQALLSCPAVTAGENLHHGAQLSLDLKKPNKLDQKLLLGKFELGPEIGHTSMPLMPNPAPSPMGTPKAMSWPGWIPHGISMSPSAPALSHSHPPCVCGQWAPGSAGGWGHGTTQMLGKALAVHGSWPNPELNLMAWG